MSLFANLKTWLERSRLRQDLLRRDDRVLADIGVSRALLEGGVRAWPWQPPADALDGAGPYRLRRPGGAGFARAVAELQALSDAELRDLGLTRGGIEEAVLHGRPGFPEEQRQAA